MLVRSSRVMSPVVYHNSRSAVGIDGRPMNLSPPTGDVKTVAGDPRIAIE